MSIIEDATSFSRDFECHEVGEKGFDHTKFLEKTQEFLSEEHLETALAITAGNIEEILDGFADQAFVAINGIYKTFRALGQNHEDATNRTVLVMQTVCNANNAKRNADQSISREKNGKVLKPEGWNPPSHLPTWEGLSFPA